MNVAFVCGSLRKGGAERFTVNMLNSFCKEKNAIAYALTGEKKENEYTLNNEVKRAYMLKETFLLSDSMRVRKYLKKHKIDIVVGIGIYANWCVCLANFCLKTRVIISERNAPKHDHLSRKSRFLRYILYPLADFYVFQTEGAKKCYSKKIQKRSVVIHNPIKDNLPSKSKIDKNEIIAVGRLLHQKNYPMLIYAFNEVHKRYPDYILRIFGDIGYEYQNLKSLCSKLHLDNNVIFEGFVLDVHEKIRDSQIFVMTSDFEGMPNSLMEAMAMGFPVVSTDCPSGGPAELIVDGVNGLLCSVGDYISFSGKIIKLIEDKKLRDTIGKAAITIRTTHCSKNIINQWKSVLRG